MLWLKKFDHSQEKVTLIFTITVLCVLWMSFPVRNIIYKSVHQNLTNFKYIEASMGITINAQDLPDSDYVKSVKAYV